jgi:hypothetical protein
MHKAKEYLTKKYSIGPMIYCVPDFETLQTYVLDKGVDMRKYNNNNNNNNPI